jgi:predicted O-methyltransferase YrrM
VSLTAPPAKNAASPSVWRGIAWADHLGQSLLYAQPISQGHNPIRNLYGHARFTAGSFRLLLSARRAYRHSARQASSPDDAAAAAFLAEFGPLSIRPFQVRQEAVELTSLLAAEKPQRVLEIGTASGGTLYLFAWASSPTARLLSVDIRKYDWWHERLFESFSLRRQRVAIRQADSHDPATRTLVEGFFDGLPLDFLFVDGDHSYDSVRRDYELYAPLVRDGGLIAFHDIVDGREEMVGGVPRFWREVRTELDDPREIVESWEQGGYGIGLGRRRSVR